MKDLEFQPTKTFQDLKDLIHQWLSESDKRSIASLARSADVSENCLRRVMNQNSIPTIDNLLKVLFYITQAKNHEELIRSVPENLKEHLISHLGYLKIDDIQNYRQMYDKESELKDFAHKIIFERSCIGHGINQEEVIQMFGQKGEKAAKELIQSGLIEFHNRIYKAKSEYINHCYSPEFTKKYSTEIINEFIKLNTDDHLLVNFTEGVNLAGYIEINRTILECTNKIRNIIAKSPGEIPMSVVQFIDTLTYENIIQTTRGDK